MVSTGCLGGCCTGALLRAWKEKIWREVIPAAQVLLLDVGSIDTHSTSSQDCREATDHICLLNSLEIWFAESQ